MSDWRVSPQPWTKGYVPTAGVPKLRCEEGAGEKRCTSDLGETMDMWSPLGDIAESTLGDALLLSTLGDSNTRGCCLF